MIGFYFVIPNYSSIGAELGNRDVRLKNIART